MKWKLLSAVVASCVLISAACGDTGPAPTSADTPATQLARSARQIQADIQAAALELNRTMPSHDTLVDPVAREKAAPVAIPALQNMVNAIDEAVPVAAPTSKIQLTALKYHLLGTLSLLGDAQAHEQLEADAAGVDKDNSEAASLALLSTDWLRNHADAAAQARILERIEAMVKADPSSNATASAAFSMYQGGGATPELTDRAKEIATNVSTSPFAKQQKQFLADEAKLAALENKPLVIEGHGLDGKLFSSSQYAGKVILVDFWATWCGPCKAELPRIKDVYRQNHERGFEIVGVSCDRDGEALKAFLKADPEMSWVELYEPGEQFNPLAIQYGVDIIPRMLLIDRNGICRTVEGRAKLERLLPILLAEPVQNSHASDH
jgi:thiol-disulfide isomerase/thioredoxin